MGILGRQFGQPAGLVGHLVGRLMARGNAPLNVALIDRVHTLHGEARRIVEVGFGPGIGLSGLLDRYPDATIVGVDPSAEMIAQCGKRHRGATGSGRLLLRRGDLMSIGDNADLLLAVHVLYFWHDPARELRHARTILAGGGLLALGYRCRQDMPPPARRDFPREGHRLYDSEEEVAGLLVDAGFHQVENHLITSGGNDLGWLTVGRAD